MRLDLRFDIGVPGWIDPDGRHHRLAEIATPERVHQHRRAVQIMALSLAKLLNELNEAEGGMQ